MSCNSIILNVGANGVIGIKTSMHCFIKNKLDYIGVIPFLILYELLLGMKKNLPNLRGRYKPLFDEKFTSYINIGPNRQQKKKLIFLPHIYCSGTCFNLKWVKVMKK